VRDGNARGLLCDVNTPEGSEITELLYRCAERSAPVRSTENTRTEFTALQKLNTS